MSIAKNLSDLRASLPAGVTLVAVSKTHPVEAILEAYGAGQRIFGENRPQEMAAKRAVLAALSDSPADIRWHQIGHLQTNKVKLIAPFVDMIHSLDSARLAVEISRQAAALGRAIDVLLEIRIAREQSKEGWVWDELAAWLEGGQWRELTGVRFRGVMGGATFTDDEAVVRGEFERLTAMHETLRERFFSHGDNCPRGSHFGTDFDTISMGMSDDYRLAIECGSTMVRVGSAIFGARQYK
jgi:pyridoxal phosphate enzyme (YggS family)